MSLIQIPLPYTEGAGVLHLNTGPASYARLASDVFQHDTVVNIREKAKEAYRNANDAMDKIKPSLDSTEGFANDHPAATLVEAAENAAKDAAEFRDADVATGKLFKITVDAARAVAAAARSVFTTFTNTEKITSRCAIYDRMKKAIEHAKASMDADEQAAEFKRNNKKMVLVIGGGVSGLMTAWILLDRGYRVTIVAKEWREMDAHKEERMTSQIAGALWEYPPGGCGLSEIEVPVLAYSKLTQYREWAMQSFLFYEHFATKGLDGLGARMITLYQLFHHNSQDARDSGSGQSGGEVDPVVRRVQESANDHHNKWKAIRHLDREPGHFRDKLKVGHWRLPTGRGTQPSDLNADVGEAGPKWEEALSAISYKSEDFKLAWGYSHRAPVVDTDVAMKFLMELVRSKGAILETREIKEDLHLQERELGDDFKADIIVNASGLGARTLANDNQIFPVRGAVRRMTLVDDPQAKAAEREKHHGAVRFLRDNAVLLPAQYDHSNNPSKTIFIVPRNEKTIVVGSIIQRNNWDLGLTLQSPEVEDMWVRATKFVEALSTRKKDDRPLAQGLRPFSHSNVRVSADNRTTGCRVVHNYGHGGSGWTLAIGCAWTCVRIVEKILHEGKSGSVANAEVWGLN